jgi:hypothetical protein
VLSPEQVIDLRLSVAELQTVLGALGEMPYRLAAPVIEKVRKQILDVDPESFGNRPSLNGATQQSAIGGRDGL